MTKLADLIWKNAELLRGAFKENEYRKVILPFTVLRRLDCVLAPTRDKVLAKYSSIKDKGYDLDKFLTTASGFAFYNTSPFTLPGLLSDPDHIRDNLEACINGFSANVRRIFEKFGFMQIVDKLAEKQRLYLVTQRFAETDLRPEVVSNHDMGQAFEELLRKFNDVSPAGEQYTPRDVIHLMIAILFHGDDDALATPGVVRTMYDPAAGTGGILSESEEHLRRFNDRARLTLYGQELEDETFAICQADMLIRGQDPANIADGDTLAADKHANLRPDYMASNPPYGVEWKPAKDDVEREHKKGAAGRFGPGLPRISDGQLLFSLHLLSKMAPVVGGKGGSRIGIVHNGSPLFTGDAGSGESEIRRWMLEHDYIDAIVALPTDMFYNTNIATYLWFMSNRKPQERKGKVLLIDASGMSVLIKKNLGKKRREFSADCIERITQAYATGKNMSWQELDANGKPARSLKAKSLPISHFFYRRITVERPLRLAFQAIPERVASLLGDKNIEKLPEEHRKFLVIAIQALDAGVRWRDADSFRAAVQAAAKEAGAAKPLAAKALELARKHLGERDRTAEPATDEKGKLLSDSDLRDAEYVPFETLVGFDANVDTALDSFFAAEVLPHWPDAWINRDVKDDKDKLTGIIGAEINFNREFYTYTPPRSRDQIKAEIEAMESRFMDMLRGVVG